MRSRRCVASVKRSSIRRKTSENGKSCGESASTSALGASGTPGCPDKCSNDDLDVLRSGIRVGSSPLNTDLAFGTLGRPQPQGSRRHQKSPCRWASNKDRRQGRGALRDALSSTPPSSISAQANAGGRSESCRPARTARSRRRRVGATCDPNQHSPTIGAKPVGGRSLRWKECPEYSWGRTLNGTVL